MPRDDGTGPMGQGSQSGRGLGKCSKNNLEDNTLTAKRRVGKRFRMGFQANDRAGLTNESGKAAGSGMGRSRRGNNQ